MTKAKKILAVVLAVVMMLSTSVTAFAASFNKTKVTLPDGTNAKMVNVAMENLWDMIANDVVPMLTDELSVKDGLDPILTSFYTNETVGKIFGVYYQLVNMDLPEQAKGIVSALLSPANIASKMTESKFATAQSKIFACSDIAALASTSFENGDFGFQDYDRDGFLNAVYAVLRPITYVIAGNQGGITSNPKSFYTALVPIFEQLGCKTLPTPDEFYNKFKAANKADKNTSGDLILKPFVDDFFKNVLYPDATKDPLHLINKLLPRIAYIIDSEMINQLIQDVFKAIPTLAAFIDPSTINLSKDVINQKITSIDLIALLDSLLNGDEENTNTSDEEEQPKPQLFLKAPNWKKLANAATAKDFDSALGGKFTLRNGDYSSFSLLFYYLYNNLLANPNYPIVKAVAGEMLGDTVGGMVTKYTDELNSIGRMETYKRFLELFGDADKTKDAGKELGKTIQTVNDVLTFTVINASKATVKLSRQHFAYNGKIQKPTVKVVFKGATLKKGKDFKVTYPKGCKKIGFYTLKVTFMGNYKGSAKKTFSIGPKNTPIKKVTGIKGGFKIKWRKQPQNNNGYQIIYSTNKKFQNATLVTVNGKNKTSKTIKGLQKGKYYVRMRTFKIINGKRCASAWSLYSKTVKVK